MRPEYLPLSRLDMHPAYCPGSLTFLRPDAARAAGGREWPAVLNVEPTNACNLRCRVCPRQLYAERWGTTLLDMAVYRRLVTEAAGQRPLIMLNLHKDGEPLLHPGLPQFVNLAKKHLPATTVHLNTNGVLLTGELGRMLLAAGLDDMTVSIDAARADTYRRLKGEDLLAVVEKNVERFVVERDRQAAGCTVRVKITDRLVSEEEIGWFVDRWQGVADQVQIGGLHSWAGAIEGIDESYAGDGQRYPCPLLYYALAVNADGTVSTCNVDWNRENVVGDLAVQTIGQIWQKSLFLAEIRRRHEQGRWRELSVCQRCNFWRGGPAPEPGDSAR
ncbi:MAG: radical SAM protein [Negativicutes bacterium]|nr:radical SAM protein [Negativicutes bacterium]